MPVPLLIMAGAAAAPAVIQGIQSIKQNRLAKQIHPDRTGYDNIMRQSLQSAQQQALSQRMPNQGYMEDQVAQNTANTMAAANRGATSASNYMINALQAGKTEQQGMLNVGAQAAQYQQGRQDNLQSELGRQAAAAYQDYSTQAATKSALTEAARQNMMGAVSGLASTAVSAGMMGAFNGAPASMSQSTVDALKPLFSVDGPITDAQPRFDGALSDYDPGQKYGMGPANNPMLNPISPMQNMVQYLDPITGEMKWRLATPNYRQGATIPQTYESPSPYYTSGW